MPSKKGKPGGGSGLKNFRSQQATGGADYASWLMLVPKEKRLEISALIKETDIKEYDDLITFSTKIMAALMEGRITPVIARELRAWHELNFTVLATKNTANGTPQDAYSDVITALVAVKRERKQLRGDYFDSTEAIEVKSPLMVGEKK